MSFLELIRKRKSCRKYLSQAVEREKIERCLEAARLAPSACNSQPWYFIVVDDPELKNKLAAKVFSGIYQSNAFAKEAPVLVIVVRQQSTYLTRLGGAFRGVQYSLIDLGIVGDHFTLQAAEEGLGTCWIGWFDEKQTKKVLGLDKNKKVDIIISLGYPQDDFSRPKTRKTKEELREYR